MVFSLLSAATSSAAGRSYVWDCICYLIDRDQINDINFTPCRHLVLRFLQGSVLFYRCLRYIDDVILCLELF